MVTVSEIARALEAGDLYLEFRGLQVRSISELHSVTRGDFEVDLEGKWSPVVGFEGWYEVSSLGQVRRVRSGKGTFSGRVLKQYTTPNGYKQVRLSKFGNGRFLRGVHVLVAQAFIPNPQSDPVVRHLDDNPSHNAISNLAWGDQGDNLRDSVRNGTHFWSSGTHCSSGHEFTEKNTLIRSDGGARRCKICDTDRKARWYEKKKKSMLDSQTNREKETH